MAPLSRRTRSALAVGAVGTVAYAVSVAIRRALNDAASTDLPGAKRRHAELEREMALEALDEETLNLGSRRASVFETRTRKDSAADASQDSLATTRSGSDPRWASTESRDPEDEDDESERLLSDCEENKEHESTPNFFASTKFFACLELEESRELFNDAAEFLDFEPGVVVFRQGDDSSSGIYIVESGSLGVYLQETQTGTPGNGTGPSASARNANAARKVGANTVTGPPFLTNILREGESVGDIDVLDNAPRGVSVVAGERGARLVRISQHALFAFIEKHPRTLETYVTQAVARLWRVALFVLVDFLGLPKPRGDAVALDSLGGTSGENEGTSGEDEDKSQSKLKKTQRLSPAFGLVKHVDALKKHCPSLDPGAKSDTSQSVPLKLYSAGEVAECMFLVLRGTARADATPWPKGDGAPGSPSSSPSLIGASAFLTRSARQETVRVEVEGSPGDGAGDTEVNESEFASSSAECLVLKIGLDELTALRAHEPAVYVAVLLAATTSLSKLLRQFIGLGLNRVWLKAGESAYKAGEPATSMFVLISGRISLRWRGSGGGGAGVGGSSERTEERGRGESIGEAPLLSNGAYETTTTCLRDSELVRMSRESLTLVCAKYPQAASRQLEHMARKLHATMGGVKPRHDLVTIALVPAEGEDEAVSSVLASKLQHELSKFGPTLVLDESTARHVFQDKTIDATKLHNAFYRSKLTGWMAAQEENFRFILLRADAAASAWSQVCVSQADRVVVVARVTRESGASEEDDETISWGKRNTGHEKDDRETEVAKRGAPSRAERRLLWRRRAGASVELVLVHDPGVAPMNTARWRSCRPEVRRHHMLRLGADEDVRRLARHVAGRAVGVVLTGGGGHGLAHLGALRALEEAGVPIDVVGGTSRGALVAALYAKYASTHHVLPIVTDLVGVLSSQRNLLLDLTLPVLSLFSGKALDRVLRNALGRETNVEDLWLPFVCCSTNLTKGELATHVTGTVWKKVRASMTTLGLLPPVVDENGDVLVDGGYLNPVPVDVLRHVLSADIVIVVDVADDDYLAFRDLTPRDGGLGGWRLLWERAWPFFGLQRIEEFVGAYFPKLFGAQKEGFGVRKERGLSETTRAMGGERGRFTGRRRGVPKSAASHATPSEETESFATENTDQTPGTISYASLLGALLHATSTRQFRVANKEHAINLYLRPPGVSGWTQALTPGRVDLLVRRAQMHSSLVIGKWQETRRDDAERGKNEAPALVSETNKTQFGANSAVPLSLRRVTTTTTSSGGKPLVASGNVHLGSSETTAGDAQAPPTLLVESSSSAADPSTPSSLSNSSFDTAPSDGA